MKRIVIASALTGFFFAASAADLANGEKIIKNAGVDCSSDTKESWELMFDNGMVEKLPGLTGTDKDDAKAYCMKYASNGIRISK